MKTRYAIAIAATSMVAVIPTAGWAASLATPPQEPPCADSEWMQAHAGDMSEHWSQMQAWMDAEGGMGGMMGSGMMGSGMMGSGQMPHRFGGSTPPDPGS